MKKSPKNEKFVWISRVWERWQIVIPKEAREMFGIKPWDSIIVLCDKKKWMALLKADAIEDLTDKLFSK